MDNIYAVVSPDGIVGNIIVWDGQSNVSVSDGFVVRKMEFEIILDEDSGEESYVYKFPIGSIWAES